MEYVISDDGNILLELAGSSKNQCSRMFVLNEHDSDGTITAITDPQYRRTMGNSGSSPIASQPELRNSVIPVRLPMPASSEIDIRFTKALQSMDLPPDKVKLLKSYKDDKKWDLICDQERVIAKDPPDVYLTRLQTYLDPRRSHRRKKILGDATSTQVLRDLEISLRTNHIEWVRDFLSEDNQGLDVLVNYLSFTQVVMRREQLLNWEKSSSLDSGLARSPLLRKMRRSNTIGSSRGLKFSSKYMGEARDDVHLCIMCLRAIMNHQYGFNLVIAHTHAINCITLSLNHKSLRTKALVLELLAAVCLVSGGHEIILAAFDNFKEVCGEKHRFETLMEYFKNFEEFHIDFMVACMQFINIIVHSVEDMNFRVHLQFEFTQIGLDEYLDKKLRHTESEGLSVQVFAYLDNMIDVAQLLDDSETKTEALEKVVELEDELSHTLEKMQEIEEETMGKIVELEKQLSELSQEVERLRDLTEEQEFEMSTLRKTMSEKDAEALHRTTILDEKLQELATIKSHGTIPGAPSENGIGDGLHRLPSPTLVPPPAPPPPAPPPPPIPGAPPPPPGGIHPNMSAMTIKKKIQTKYRLPVLNWTPLKPNQVKGTVFSDLDDEKLYEVIDFNQFEEVFRLGPGSGLPDGMGGGTPTLLKRLRKTEKLSLMEANRLRNVAITRRKFEMVNEEIVRAIQGLDLKTLSLDMVDILLTILPNIHETKLYKEYEKDKKPVNALSDEDRFMMQLCRVERLSQKLQIMSFIGNFYDNLHHLTPQVNAIIAASMSIRNSPKVKRLLEIILAFGNYMNSAKRGGAYGFKLQSLDILVDTKSVDKKVTLVHFLAQTIQDKFPELLNFEAELRFIEKASLVSLENIVTDMHDLEKGMDLTKKEFENRKDYREMPVLLKDFLSNSQDKFQRLQSDVRTAKDAYTKVVEYYGENARSVPPTTFFAHFVRFVNAFKEAIVQNEKRYRLAYDLEVPKPSKKKDKKAVQEAMVNELKHRNRQIKEKKILNKDDVYHGALEDILLDLKNEPYRRADAVRRSQRRRVEGLVHAPTGRSSEMF